MAIPRNSRAFYRLFTTSRALKALCIVTKFVLSLLGCRLSDRHRCRGRPWVQGQNGDGFAVGAQLPHADGTAVRRAAIDISMPTIPARRGNHARRRQALQSGPLRRRAAYDVCHPAHCSQSERLGPGWPHHAASGLRGEPEEAQADRGLLRRGKTVGPIAKMMLRGHERVRTHSSG